MGESLEGQQLGRCVGSFAYSRFYFLSGKKRKRSPLPSGKLLTLGPVSSYILGRKRKMLWEIGSQANMKLTLRTEELSLSGSLRQLCLLFLQVTIDYVPFGMSPFT